MESFQDLNILLAVFRMLAAVVAAMGLATLVCVAALIGAEMHSEPRQARAARTAPPARVLELPRPESLPRGGAGRRARAAARSRWDQPPPAGHPQSPNPQSFSGWSASCATCNPSADTARACRGGYRFSFET